MKANTILHVAAAFAVGLPVANAQLIINGSFESPDTSTYIRISAGQSTIAPWSVGLHSVEVGDAAGNGFIVGPAFEGGQFLDLNGIQRGRLTQSFATVPGSLYTVTFAYTDNYWEPAEPAPASARVRLFDSSGDRLNETITHASATAGDYDWTVFTGQFTALQNRTSLEFTSLSSSPGGHTGSIMLDAVQVFEGPSLKILSIQRNGNGSVALNVRGVPKGLHRIQARADFSAGSFVDIATVRADTAGIFQFQDTHRSLTGALFRVRVPSPGEWSLALNADPGGINGVNTASVEGCPIESPDGLSLFFASNRAGGHGGLDIWMARRDGIQEPWRDPVNLPSPVNSSSDDFCPTPLLNGELLFVSRRPGGCSENSADLFRTRTDTIDGWILPTHLGCEINSAGDEFSPSYRTAGEGGTLFFSSNRDGTHRIYQSERRPDGSFDIPAEVTELNATGFNTFRPNISEDGLEILFDSDRPGGLGGTDIWSATRASVASAWSRPVNLGPGVNSPSNESRASFSWDGKRLTFGTTRTGGQGSSDIHVSTR